MAFTNVEQVAAAVLRVRRVPMPQRQVVYAAFFRGLLRELSSSRIQCRS